MPCGLMANRWGESNCGCSGVTLKYHMPDCPESNRMGMAVLVSARYFATVAVLFGGRRIFRNASFSSKRVVKLANPILSGLKAVGDELVLFNMKPKTHEKIACVHMQH